jgi:hypothetical protein
VPKSGPAPPRLRTSRPAGRGAGTAGARGAGSEPDDDAGEAAGPRRSSTLRRGGSADEAPLPRLPPCDLGGVGSGTSSAQLVISSDGRAHATAREGQTRAPRHAMARVEPPAHSARAGHGR